MKSSTRSWFILFSLFSISVLVISLFPITMPFILFGLFVLVMLLIIDLERKARIAQTQVENELIVIRQKLSINDAMSHDSLQLLINDLPVGICFISNHGVIRYVNAPFMAAEGKTFAVNDSYHVMQSNNRFYPFIYRTMLFEKPLSERVTLDGKTFQIETQFHSASQPLSGVLAIVVDINDFQVAQTRQTAFLADVTHELKTPISAILGASEMLFRDEANMTSAEKTEFITMISQEAQRMNSLVSELLDLTRLSTNNGLISKIVVPINPLVNDVTNLLKSDSDQKGLCVENHIPLEFKALVDVQRFKQVLINLINNAIRYSNKGTITITAEEDAFFSMISVTDHGIGIAEKELPFIFDRFYRSDKSRHRDQGGAGIGLAVTKTIITAHGGTVDVQSVLGEGTTFTIRIPRVLQ